MSPKLAAAALTAIASAMACGPADATTYDVTVIGSPPVNNLPNYVDGKGLNNLGQVVGFTDNYSPFTTTAFSYIGGVRTDVSPPGSATSAAFGVNDAGTIVGSYGATGTFPQPYHGFIDQGGVFTTLDAPGATNTSLISINNASQVLGTSDSPTAAQFIYANGVYTALALSVPGAFSTEVTAINNAGAVLGTFSVANFAGSPFQGPSAPGGSFIYQNGTYTIIGAPGPGTVAGSTDLLGFNDLGQAVGIMADSLTSAHSVLYDNGTLTTLSQFPVGPSDQGRAVATYDVEGINDRGQIVGTRFDIDGVEAFIATPVPEPLLPGLFGGALASLAAIRSRRRS